MKVILIVIAASFFLTVASGIVFIPVLRKLKAGQPVLKYVKEHKYKQGTPTMGGILFIIPSVIVFLLFSGYNGRLGFVAVAIGLSFMCVGFLDDYIKIKSRHNEGLKPYQKIVFQGLIAIFSGVFCYINGITLFFVPYTNNTVQLGIWTVPIVFFIFIAITNSVNLTDGLDGLAGSVSIIYLIIFMALMYFQINRFADIFADKTEYENLLLLNGCVIGGLSGFLLFNVSNAKIFMGDTGSLALGGIIGSVSIFASDSFFIPIIGIMFAVSSISVIVQVIHFKRTGKRVFLMAPFHHHLQLKGNSETRIGYIYVLITLFFGISVLFPFM